MTCEIGGIEAFYLSQALILSSSGSVRCEENIGADKGAGFGLCPALGFEKFLGEM
jgi:hypothetical protein